MKFLITILLISLSMNIFAKETQEQKFWKWFQKNETKLFHFENNSEVVLDEISTYLTTYKDGLTFEISVVIDGKREFIVSADGIREYFPDVEKLVASSPRMANWEIVAFRPRVNDYSKSKLKYRGKEFDPSELWIKHSVEDGFFDLEVYYPNYTEEEKNIFISGIYILLDMALGEYDVVTGIRYISHNKLIDLPVESGLVPFSQLRDLYDQYHAKEG